MVKDSEAEAEEAEEDVDKIPAARVTAEKTRRKRPKLTLGKRIKKRWRAWLRAVHRDIGYLAVGLTFVYALSGIAINHIGSWNPNFSKVTDHHTISSTIDADDEELAAKQVLTALSITEEPSEFFFESDEELEINFTEKQRRLVVDITTGAVTETYEKERFFLRVANWLHYNRGKAAWTYIADGYAVFLLFLALSGMFMLKGKKGLIGRGIILVSMGAAVPILYVTLASGP